MVKKGNFKFYKNIVLDEKGIKELISLLQKYCTTLEFEVTTRDENQIKFDSCDELLAYENFKAGRIKILELAGYKNYSNVFRVKFFGKRHAPPYVEGTYNFSDTDAETLFVNKLKEFLEKNVEGYYPCRILSFLVLLLLLIAGFYLLVLCDPLMMDTLFAILFWVVLLYYLIGNKLLGYFFPSVTFNWGEETKKHVNRINNKNNIFWCVIVAFFVGGLAGVFFARLM